MPLLRHTVMCCALLLAAASLSCTSLFDDPGACTSRSECEAWQVCDGELGLCVFDPARQRCDASASVDTCGVGATCVRGEGVEYCEQRPLRVRALYVSGGIYTSATVREIMMLYRLAIEGEIARTIRPLFRDEFVEWDIDFQMLLSNADGIPAQLDRLQNDPAHTDADILIAFNNSSYTSLASAFPDTLLLGLSNLRADVVLAERAGGVDVKPLTERMDFSIFPTQDAEWATIAKHLREEDDRDDAFSCVDLLYVHDTSIESSRLEYALFSEQAPRYGYCHAEQANLPSGSMPSPSMMEQLQEENTCVFWLSYGPNDVMARAMLDARARGEGPSRIKVMNSWPFVMEPLTDLQKEFCSAYDGRIESIDYEFAREGLEDFLIAYSSD